MAILCAIRSPSSAASGISQTFNQSSCEIQFFGGSKMAFPGGKIGQVSRSEAIPVGAKQFLRKFDGLRGFEVSRNFQSIYSRGLCRIDENGPKLGGNGLYVDRKGSKSGNARVVYAGINSKKLSGRNLRVAVIGGGPAGGCTAETLVKGGVETFLIERKLDNAKPCGGAIPLCMVDEFKLPLDIIDRRVTKMKMISPSNVAVDVGRTLKENEYIGMVRREVLDSYLRERAASCGANVINGLFMKMELPKDSGSPYVLHYNLYDGKSSQGTQSTLEVDAVVGADGANSRVAKGMVAGEYDYAIAFQERIKIPEDKMSYYENLAEMYVGDDVSPDFYGWVFPKCDHVAVGTGTVINKPAIKEYQVATRNRAKKKIEGGKIIRVEAHPIPEHPRPRRVRDRVALVGDAAGYVTKSSGEGIYFAAKSGRMCAEAIVEGSGNGARMINEADLRKYVEKWDKTYWPTYKVLDLLQRVFYRSNAAREAFVEMCADDYVQKMTFDSYLYKTVAPGTPLRDFKLAVKTVGSLLRVNALRKEMKKLSM